MDNELISIITQTNNNDKGLTKIYESLIQNSGYGLNLEWLILNNGQTDEIYEIVEYFENLEDLKIKYIHIPNLKQNECLNYLIESSEGAYVLECKDNEYFTQNGLRKVKENIFPLPNIYGFVFVNKKYEILENQEEKVLTYNTLKSNVFTDEYLNQNLNMFEIMLSKFNLEGDENLENYTIVYNNNIRKKVNLLFQENETYITKKDIFNLLDKRGYVFCFNDIIKYYEESNLDQTQLNNEIINNIYKIDNNIYLDDEILNNILTEEEKKYLLNPKGYFKYFENFFSFPFETGICKINNKTRTHYIKKYLLSAFLSGKQININKIKDKTNKFLINLLKPYAYIEYKLKGYLSKRDKYENIYSLIIKRMKKNNIDNVIDNNDEIKIEQEQDKENEYIEESINIKIINEQDVDYNDKELEDIKINEIEELVVEEELKEEIEEAVVEEILDKEIGNKVEDTETTQKIINEDKINIKDNEEKIEDKELIDFDILKKQEDKISMLEEKIRILEEKEKLKEENKNELEETVRLLTQKLNLVELQNKAIDSTQIFDKNIQQEKIEDNEIVEEKEKIKEENEEIKEKEDKKQTNVFNNIFTNLKEKINLKADKKEEKVEQDKYKNMNIFGYEYDDYCDDDGEIEEEINEINIETEIEEKQIIDKKDNKIDIEYIKKVTSIKAPIEKESVIKNKIIEKEKENEKTSNIKNEEIKEKLNKIEDDIEIRTDLEEKKAKYLNKSKNRNKYNYKKYDEETEKNRLELLKDLSKTNSIIDKYTDNVDKFLDDIKKKDTFDK